MITASNRQQQYNVHNLCDIHGCCIKTLTDYSFHVCSPTVVGLRYVMPINKRIFDFDLHLSSITYLHFLCLQMS